MSKRTTVIAVLEEIALESTLKYYYVYGFSALTLIILRYSLGFSASNVTGLAIVSLSTLLTVALAAITINNRENKEQKD